MCDVMFNTHEAVHQVINVVIIFFIEICKGTSLNFRKLGSAHDKNWTQSDLRFCKNYGSKRSKINEKGLKCTRYIRSTIRRKLIQNA